MFGAGELLDLVGREREDRLWAVEWRGDENTARRRELTADAVGEQAVGLLQTFVEAIPRDAGRVSVGGASLPLTLNVVRMFHACEDLVRSPNQQSRRQCAAENAEQFELTRDEVRPQRATDTGSLVFDGQDDALRRFGSLAQGESRREACSLVVLADVGSLEAFRLPASGDRLCVEPADLEGPSLEGDEACQAGLCCAESGPTGRRIGTRDRYVKPLRRIASKPPRSCRCDDDALRQRTGSDDQHASLRLSIGAEWRVPVHEGACRRVRHVEELRP